MMAWRLDRRAVQEEFRKLGVALMVAAVVGGLFEDRLPLGVAIVGLLGGLVIVVGGSVYREVGP